MGGKPYAKCVCSRSGSFGRRPMRNSRSLRMGGRKRFRPVLRPCSRRWQLKESGFKKSPAALHLLYSPHPLCAPYPLLCLPHVLHSNLCQLSGPQMHALILHPRQWNGRCRRARRHRLRQRLGHVSRSLCCLKLVLQPHQGLKSPLSTLIS